METTGATNFKTYQDVALNYGLLDRLEVALLWRQRQRGDKHRRQEAGLLKSGERKRLVIPLRPLQVMRLSLPLALRPVAKALKLYVEVSARKGFSSLSSRSM